MPLSAFASTRWISGPMQSIRYNGYPTMRIAGDAAPGLVGFGGFTLGGMSLALPMAALREVLPCAGLTPLPCPAPAVPGGVDLRGTTVAALVDRFRSPLATPIPLTLADGRSFHVLARFNWPVWTSLAEAMGNNPGHAAPAVARPGPTPRRPRSVPRPRRRWLRCRRPAASRRGAEVDQVLAPEVSRVRLNRGHRFHLPPRNADSSAVARATRCSASPCALRCMPWPRRQR